MSDSGDETDEEMTLLFWKEYIDNHPILVAGTVLSIDVPYTDMNLPGDSTLSKTFELEVLESYVTPERDAMNRSVHNVFLRDTAIEGTRLTACVNIHRDTGVYGYPVRVAPRLDLIHRQDTRFVQPPTRNYIPFWSHVHNQLGFYTAEHMDIDSTTSVVGWGVYYTVVSTPFLPL